MERKVPLEIGLLSIGSETDGLHFVEVVVQNAVALGVVLGSIELGIALELLVGQGQLLDPVERKGDEVTLVRIVHKSIPPLVEKLHTVWLQRHHGFPLGAIPSVSYLHPHAASDGLKELMQVLAIRRNGLQKNPVVNALALGEYVVHRQGREHPVLDGVFFENLRVAYVVPVAVCPVALDVDSEDILDGILVAVERTSCHRKSFAHVCAEPLSVQVIKGNPSEPVNGVYQPDVLSENDVRSHSLYTPL